MGGKYKDYPSEKILSEKILTQKLPPKESLPKKSYTWSQVYLLKQNFESAQTPLKIPNFDPALAREMGRNQTQICKNQT